MLVPRNPTEAMLDAMHSRIRILCDPAARTADIQNDREVWAAMLAVSPPAPISVPLDRLTALDGLVDRIAEAIRDGAGLAEGDPPWERLGAERRAPWRADAKRALSVIKESLTAETRTPPPAAAQQPETVRDAFEAWAKSQGRSTNTWAETGEYTHYDTQRCWEAWQAALTAAQQQGQAKDCHCATCTCHPGMTPAVRLDTTPADKEGAVRDHLIALGWTPPNTAPPPSAHVGVDELVTALVDAAYQDGMQELDEMSADTMRARDSIAHALAQQPAAVDEAAVKRAVAAAMSAPVGISMESYVRIVLEAALAAHIDVAIARCETGHATRQQEPTT